MKTDEYIYSITTLIRLVMCLLFASTFMACKSTSQIEKQDKQKYKHKLEKKVEKKTEQEARLNCAKKEMVYKGVIYDLNKYGIGCSIRKLKDGSAIITDIIPDGPVDSSKLIHLGDMIVAISPNGNDEYIDTILLSIDQIVELIRGCSGSKLTLKVQRNGNEFLVPLTRGPVSL